MASDDNWTDGGTKPLDKSQTTDFCSTVTRLQQSGGVSDYALIIAVVKFERDTIMR